MDTPTQTPSVATSALLGCWQDISTAPKDGTWMLLYDPMTSCLIYTGCWDAKFETKWNEQTDDSEYIGAWTNYHVESFGYEEYSTLQPTHWMALPDQPNAKLSGSEGGKDSI